VDDGIADLVRLHVELPATRLRHTVLLRHVHLCPEALLCGGDSRDPTQDGSPSRHARHLLKKCSTIDASRALRVHLSHLAARSRSTETAPEASLIEARRAQRSFGDGLISF
jgi:hypothetical protein